MVRTVLAHIASFGALIISIILAIDLKKLFVVPWKGTIIIFTVVAALAAASWDICATHKMNPIQFRGTKRDKKITQFMAKLLSTDEQCVISSNDLSWAKGEAYDALVRKASKKSLTLLLPKQNPISENLESSGAIVYCYGKNRSKFTSRFTLINPERSDSRLAIGFTTSDSHLIKQIESKNDPAIHLAYDLFKFVTETNENGGSDE